LIINKAGVAELADAHDSKSCSLRECGFDPLRRHFFICLSCSRLNRNFTNLGCVFGQYSDSAYALSYSPVPTKNKSKEEFPIIVKAGSIAVKIYRDRKRSRDYFRLVFYFSAENGIV
jgi:hypothetical protein